MEVPPIFLRKKSWLSRRICTGFTSLTSPTGTPTN
jgi:hypothetical protein